MIGARYAAVAELPLRKKKSRSAKSGTTTVLLGAWLEVVEIDDDWLKVRAFSREGWVHASEVADDNPAVKFFFVDVGQGDGVLIETPTERLIVDGGPGKNFYNYLTKFKYKWLLQQNETVHIEAVVISHFDADHFAGLIALINDERFTIGTIYHNGIARFRGTGERPTKYDTDLGETRDNESGVRSVLKTTFSTLGQAAKLQNQGGLMATFDRFVTAALGAHAQGRLVAMKRLTTSSAPLAKVVGVQTEILGPVPHADNAGDFDWLTDSSHTRNGHSVVIKFTAGTRTFLLGGDLNIESEELLLETHPPGTFKVDVAKACHHGSSEFTTEFLKAVKPFMTVISSGDNENFGHPQPDAIGSIGKHSDGERPTIFSTELARSQTATRIHYGLINVRTDGTTVVGAQMFESARSGDMWNSFVI